MWLVSSGHQVREFIAYPPAFAVLENTATPDIFWAGGKAGGKGGFAPRKPFYGKCKGCGKVGHSLRECPDLGKGFKGHCKGCGVWGHNFIFKNGNVTTEGCNWEGFNGTDRPQDLYYQM